MSDLVDAWEAADRFGVKHGTFQSWAFRRKLPGFPAAVGGTPRDGFLWEWADLEAWGRDTGRIDNAGVA